ncbi:hypothetical protein J5X84_04105 [Streptosporangiaceae bacterium NEAU-GS5]|nr:hypothetical protein [Streptosporangiaceae bacterium NEAU-GS5]
MPALSTPAHAAPAGGPVLTLSGKYEWNPLFSLDHVAKARGKGTVSVTWEGGKIVKSKLTVTGRLWDQDRNKGKCAYVVFRTAPLKAQRLKENIPWKTVKSFKYCGPAHKAGKNDLKHFDFKVRNVVKLNVQLCRIAKGGGHPYGCAGWVDITPSPLPLD